MKWTSAVELKKLKEANKKFNKNRPPKRKIVKKKYVAQKKVRWNNYREYLESKTWRNLRESVLGRAKGICEICGKNRAWQVHHITYKRIFKERLSDLIAVCGVCHRDEHNLLTEEEIEIAVEKLWTL